MSTIAAGKVISTILRHDKKQNSYKIALLRSIGNIATEYPGVGNAGSRVAIPLRTLAQEWIAYYWPFMHHERRIWQGHRQMKQSGLSQDVAFRPELEQLRQMWEDEIGESSPSDGFFLVHEMRITRRRDTYSEQLQTAFDKAWRKIKRSIKYPIRYAGPGQWGVFGKPVTLNKAGPNVEALPGTRSNESCLIIQSDLWKTFIELSLWVEALCIHEWCLFTETVEQTNQERANRGHVYRLLTARPDNRRPLTWERNRVDLLLMEGRSVVCPWTQNQITTPDDYHIDHLLPLSVFPINELWNLIPIDATFNMHKKRDLLPSEERLESAHTYLSNTYALYSSVPDMKKALSVDVSMRFSALSKATPDYPDRVASAAASFVSRVAESRNIARF